MKITKLKIQGFRSFGSKEVSLNLTQKLSAFIGHNSSGKTAALEALRKIFGSGTAEREICRDDFHIAKDEDPDGKDERNLYIEVRLDFLSADDGKSAVPIFFNHMVVDDEDKPPYVRIRLEATWKKIEFDPQGSIDVKLLYVRVAEGEEETEDTKQPFPNHYRSLIQIIYVPAIRRPGEQLKYTAGSILYRVLRKIKWADDFQEKFEGKISEINEYFKVLPEFRNIQSAISNFWQQFHKDNRYKTATLGFEGSDFESVLRKLEVNFTPTPTSRKYHIEELGEGYRSLFYITLVCTLLEVEKNIPSPEASEEENQEESIGIDKPLLTIAAIEEPENHIAPQLLGRVVTVLQKLAKETSCQVFLSSHTASIIKRIDPISIFHFRISEDFRTVVNKIQLPEKVDAAYKYVKEAVTNYPEIYFAKLVVIGEGDSEEVIFNRLMKLMNLDFDDNFITFAPLGHRFVNHIWKLLDALHIPYVTLLDLDREREGGGWGRVKYAVQQLIALGKNKDELLAYDDGSILSDDDFEKMHEWDIKDLEMAEWIDFLKKYNLFYSAPLDLDFLMLETYPAYYKKAIPPTGGPRIPDKEKYNARFQSKVESSVRATLKSESATGVTYSDDQRELMIWYNYHFLGRGKPATHIEVLSAMTDKEIVDAIPAIFKEFFERITNLLKVHDESN